MGTLPTTADPASPPTPQAVLTLTAVALASRVELPQEALALPWPEVDRSAHGRTHKVGEDVHLHIFGFGAVVGCGGRPYGAMVATCGSNGGHIGEWWPRYGTHGAPIRSGGSAVANVAPTANMALRRWSRSGRQ